MILKKYPFRFRIRCSARSVKMPYELWYEYWRWTKSCHTMPRKLLFWWWVILLVMAIVQNYQIYTWVWLITQLILISISILITDIPEIIKSKDTIVKLKGESMVFSAPIVEYQIDSCIVKMPSEYRLYYLKCKEEEFCGEEFGYLVS